MFSIWTERESGITCRGVDPTPFAFWEVSEHADELLFEQESFTKPIQDLQLFRQAATR